MPIVERTEHEERNRDKERFLEHHYERVSAAAEKVQDEQDRIYNTGNTDKMDAAWEATKRFTRELESIK